VPLTRHEFWAPFLFPGVSLRSTPGYPLKPLRGAEVQHLRLLTAPLIRRDCAFLH